MPLLFGGFGLILLAFWIFCIFDVLTTDAQDTRNLPRLLWLVIVLMLPDVGSILWLVFGRPSPPWRALRREPAATTAPDDDEDFLRGLQARVEEQRRKAREQQQGDDNA